MPGRIACAAALTGAICVTAGAGELSPRVPLAKPETVERPSVPSRLTVKFRDDLRVRTGFAGLHSFSEGSLPAVEQVASRYGLTFEPLIRLPQRDLTFVESRAAARSGRAQPDLGGMMIVRGDDARLVAAAEALLELDQIEWVDFEELLPEPPCSDISPTTGDYVSLQGYRGNDPGVGVAYAWSLGARGQGVKIADCEYGYIAGTEDLCNIVDEPGQTVSPIVANNGWDNHGTAVLGEMFGLDNAYGVTGLVPDASALFFPENTVEEGGRRVTAITNAIAAVDAGDIVVLEMQQGAPGTYGPAELNLGVWTAVKAGTDGGVIVIGAAGNGNQDLDSAPYAPYMARGDSGAIIVGAGSANTGHDKLSFSTYGSRVNVQSWGGSVFTLGYGTYAMLGGDIRQKYTSTFSGTSSATPLVTSVAAAAQSYAKSTLGCTIGPGAMRDLLVYNGLPQGSGGHIGPFAYMPTTLDALAANPLGCNYGCGNGLIEGPEPCDGAAAGSCPGTCSASCQCAPIGPGPSNDLMVTGYEGGTDRMMISWSPACSADEHTLAYGPLSSVSSYGYSGQVCGMGTDGVEGPIMLGAGSWFFVVVGSDGTIEGSYGLSSAPAERPEQTGDPVCTLSQDLATACGP